MICAECGQDRPDPEFVTKHGPIAKRCEGCRRTIQARQSQSNSIRAVFHTPAVPVKSCIHNRHGYCRYCGV